MNKDKKINFNKVVEFMHKEKVVILFAIICFLGILISGIDITFLVNEVFTRIGRNSFLVLALIIPILGGMGLNFGIVIGAMSSQLALIFVLYLGVSGTKAFFLTALLSVPISIFTGWLVAFFFNKIKGNEMIGGMILGYFADGIYQFIFLILIGSFVNFLKNNMSFKIMGDFLVPESIEVKNTIDLMNSFKYSLDKIPLLNVLYFLIFVTIIFVVIRIIISLIKKDKINFIKELIIPIILCGLVFIITLLPFLKNILYSDRITLFNLIMFLLIGKIILEVVKFLNEKQMKKNLSYNKIILSIIILIVVFLLTYIKSIEKIVLNVKIPTVTFIAIGFLCLFNNWIMKTRLGQNIRTVGQNRFVANSAGINVNKTRTIAIILSTILAGWGQLISLQNLGNFQTFASHTQVAQYSIAAILVGGASTSKANNKHGILGVILFHTLFIISPIAGKKLFGNAQLGEYFRVFIAYGVIALSLAMHAWKKTNTSRIADLRKEL